jgi:hypothetical protein
MVGGPSGHGVPTVEPIISNYWKNSLKKRLYSRLEGDRVNLWNATFSKT